jgi:leukotriene A-4 hydrolase/aminopeptidase
MQRKTLILYSGFILLAAFVAACSGNKTEGDVHSFARPQEAVMTHLDLDVRVDFEKKQIAGKATLRIENKKGVDKLYLDSRDLTVERVTLGEPETETGFSTDDPQEFLGQLLVIDIQPQTKIVNIYYLTHPDAAALQWLEPEQTAGGKYPFLFTQSQAILARTWVPCQDSPGIRITYNARVRVPPQLMAVMSAENTTVKADSGVYLFQMNQPVPPYLLALAVGEIEYRSLGPRSGVFAEPRVIAKAAFEFGDTEKMIAAAEKLYGPYRWEQYDILVLPPSFPYGGMENPRLTFVTPTILAGDRSLTSLIAHELAHSWSGNLVTNATWDDFWLNEGFTTYIENRIMEELYGRSYAEMLAHLGYQDLLQEFDKLGRDSPDTRLRLRLIGRDPDAGLSNVAYEKGRLFLRLLEEQFGREKWDAFLKSYFDTFAFRSMTTGEFMNYLRENLIKKDQDMEKKLKMDQWVYEPGLPENSPNPKPGEFEQVEAQVAAWKNGTPAKELNIDNWTTHHWLDFIRHLPEKMTHEQMTELDFAFGFTQTGNYEILCAWLQNAISNRYKPAYSALENFLKTVGRRKFLRPLYQELAKSSEGSKYARTIYAEARAAYHPVAYNTVDKILGVKGEIHTSE